MKKYSNAILFFIVALVVVFNCPIAMATQTIPLDLAVRDGKVQVEIFGLGGSTGDTIVIDIKRKVPEKLHIAFNPGIVFQSTSENVQNMIGIRIKGERVNQTSYRPTTEIYLPNDEKRSYIIEAYCLDFHKPNPSPKDQFILSHINEHIKNLIILGYKNAYSTRAIQGAIWIDRDGASDSDLKKRFSLTNQEIELAKGLVNSLKPETKSSKTIENQVPIKNQKPEISEHTEIYKIYGDFESEQQKALDTDAFKHALQLNTPEAFTKYLNRPFSNWHLADAYQCLQKLDKASYEKAMNENTIIAWHRYLKYFPNGEWVSARTALEKIDAEAYRKALEKNSVTSLINYLTDAVLNPFSKNIGEAFEKIAQSNNPKVIPEIVQLLPKFKIAFIDDAVSALIKLKWKPTNPKEKVLFLAGNKQWDEIVQIGENAVRPLIQLLGVEDRHDWQERYCARDRIEIIRILGMIGDNNALIPLVLEARENYEADIRNAALRVLNKKFDWNKINFKKPIVTAEYPHKLKSNPSVKSKKWEWKIRFEETNGVAVILYQRKLILTTQDGKKYSSSPVGAPESIEPLYFNAYGKNQYSYWVKGSNYTSCSIDFIGADVFGNKVEVKTKVITE
jgi:hypothetical protein